MGMDTAQDWCVTLLAKAKDSAPIADFERQVKGEIAENAGSGQVSCILAPLPSGTIAETKRITFSIGDDSLSALQKSLNGLFSKSLDAVLHPASLHWSQYKLIVLDLDSTLVTCEGIDELAKMMGIGEKVAEITSSAMRGEIDFQQSFRKRVALLRGLEFERVLDFAKTVEVTAGATLLLRTLKSAGYKTAIATGGFDLIASRLQRELCIDDFCANTLEVADGRLTGEVKTTIIDGAGKAEFVSRLAKQQGIALSEVIVVGDGANDIPMMQLAGLSIAFHGKPKVQEAATCAVRNGGLDALLYILQLDGKEVSALTN